MGFSVLSSKTTRIVALVLRVLTAVILFASLLILVTNSQEYILYKKNKVLRFYDKIGYRYAAVIILLGIAHSIYQTVCVVVRMRKGNEGNVLFDFYAEKVMSNLLVTGAVAGFVTTGEMLNMVAQQPNGQDRVLQYQTFASLANSSSGLILLCCIFSSMLSVLSSYGLSGDYDD